MLLKNITAMNFEALALFQSNTAVEQQQATGDIKGMMAASIAGTGVGATPLSSSSALKAAQAHSQNQNLNNNQAQNDSFFRLQRGDDDEMPRRALPPAPSAPPSRAPLLDSTSNTSSSSSAGTGVGVIAPAGRPIAGAAVGGLARGVVRGSTNLGGSASSMGEARRATGASAHSRLR
jgi:hypothetical protein